MTIKGRTMTPTGAKGLLKLQQIRRLIRLIRQVRHTWADMTFDLKKPKERNDVLMLGNMNDLMSHLDDSIVTMANILTSPYVGPIRTEAEEYSKKLLLLKVRLPR